MSKRACVAALLSLLACGCGPRQVEITFLTPEECAPLLLPEPGPALACPLAHVESIETSLVRVDGTPAENDCVDTPDLCDLDDLQGLQFLQRGTPSDGVEIRMRGWTRAGCRDDDQATVALLCESFGVSVVDLTTVEEVNVWCECPLPPTDG